jgi:MYXO-CTERM domain-containing protein
VDGLCEHDPCLNIQCPKDQRCVQGQCIEDKGQTEPGLPDGTVADASTEKDPTPTEGSAENSRESMTTPDLPQGTEDPKGTVEEDTTTEKKIGGAGADESGSEGRYQSPGCACDATNPAASWWLFLVLLTFVLLRRQRVRVANRPQDEERA